MAPRELKPLWEVGDLPFHIGTRTSPTNGDLPDVLPFALGVDEQCGAVAQMPNPDVSSALEAAYRAGSQIGTPLATEGLGKPPFDDFMGFLRDVAGGSFDGLRIVEIGSGAGAVLSALAEQGAEVVGVEPDEEHARASELPVIAKPFTRDLFEEKFDLVINYGVLEHVEDPATFAADQLAVLAPEGKLAFSVPNCDHHLAQGDVAMLVHEHWSYFDEDSLAALAAITGAEVVDTRAASAAGARYSVWRPGTGGRNGGTGAAGPFAEKARRSVDQLREYLEPIRDAGGALGVFAPSRFFNYQQLLLDSCPDLRYFDDDERHVGKYYPPFPIEVEARASLLEEPVDHLLIASFTFGDRLAGELEAEPALADTEIRTISDVLS